MKDAIEKFFYSVLESISGRHTQFDNGSIIMALAIFYIGNAIFKLADSVYSASNNIVNNFYRIK